MQPNFTRRLAGNLEVIMLRFVVMVFGFSLCAVSTMGEYFLGAVAGASGSPSWQGYIGNIVVSLGIFGPLFILGLHSTLFRWSDLAPNDRVFINVMAALVVTSMIALIAGDPNGDYVAWISFFAVFLASFAFSAFGVKLGGPA